MFNYRKLFFNPIRNIKDCDSLSIFRSLGFIGDSLSSGEHEAFMNGVKSFHDYYEYSWGQYIARKCGLKAYNFSQGGLKARTFFTMIKDKEERNPFTGDKFCQAYFIALGVNDMNHIDTYSDGFGSLDDVDWENEDNNKDSFVGQYVRIIQKIRKLSPKSRIFVITIPKNANKNNYETLCDKHAKFLNILPKYFEFLYVVDLRKYAPIFKKIRDKYFLGGHMNALGYKFFAELVMSYCEFIINKNYKDFSQVGFINKDVHNELDKW